MFTAAVALMPAHVSRRAVAQTLGLLARPARLIVPRMGETYAPGSAATTSRAAVPDKTA
jgi:hypothetical protein